MPRFTSTLLFVVPFISALVCLSSADAADTAIPLLYQNRHFEPASLTVAAKKPFKIAVTNHDSAAIEFESFELHRERVVAPGETITVLIPALAPGSYPFFDDFHQDAPKGVIVAK